MTLSNNYAIRGLLLLASLGFFAFFFFYFFKEKVLPEKPIVAVITSFNNAKWVYKNLDSIFEQDYKNYRVIYLDDCSTDGTGDLVEQYIQEKNVGDKFTLICNKQRSIKMLNLYTIYHSLDDWNISAQIDGDDWLTDKNVFKEINKAYNKGNWLAYTQFDLTTGEKGSNALPPSWVSKKGLFRQYQPMWFMYSHLKTFYAWLFKHIKLQDLIDDKTGMFPPVCDDVLVMFPMLEMARDKFSFINRSCYMWNVNPGFRPSLALENNENLYKEFLKKPSYQSVGQAITQRLKNYDNAKADLLVFAKSAKSAQLLVDSIKENLSGVGTIYLIGLPDPTNINNGSSKIECIGSKELSRSFFDQLSNHVIIADAQHVFAKPIDLTKCIKELEQTFAHGFYLGLSKEDDIFNSSKKDSIPLQSLNHGLYAWKFGCQKNSQFSENPMVLMRKKDIDLTMLQSFTMIKDQENILKSMRIADKNAIGLFYENSISRAA